MSFADEKTGLDEIAYFNDTTMPCLNSALSGGRKAETINHVILAASCALVRASDWLLASCMATLYYRFSNPRS